MLVDVLFMLKLFKGVWPWSKDQLIEPGFFNLRVLNDKTDSAYLQKRFLVHEQYQAAEVLKYESESKEYF
jgi:hypothetical protein